MKTFIRKLLRKTGLLYRIQYSQWYRQYKTPDYKKEIDDLLRFYKELFIDQVPSLMFDIGANAGSHTYTLSKIFKKIVCVEPDEMNNDILRSRFGNNKNITIVKKAVAEKEGISTFYMEEDGSVLNTLSSKWVDVLNKESESRFGEIHKFKQTKKVETISLDKLIQLYGKPDYMKIDVEGFEKEVISGLHEKVKIICLECNLPEFAQETLWIIDHLYNINNHVVFNFVKGDKYGFQLENNIDAMEMKALISGGKYRFMDMYCFN